MGKEVRNEKREMKQQIIKAEGSGYSGFIVFLALTTKDDLKWNPYSVFYQALEVVLGYTQV